MKVRMFINLAFMAALLLIFSPQGFSLEGNTPVARVGNLELTNTDLSREIQKLIPLNVSFHGKVSAEKMAEIRAKAMTALIERTLKVQFALKNEIAASNQEADERVQKLVSRFKSEAAMVKAYGVSDVGEVRAALYRELLAEKAEKTAVKDSIVVSEAEIAEYYQTNTSRYQLPRQFRASHILVKVDPSSNQQERAARLAKAEKLLEQARAGEDFYNLAYYNSDDRTRYVGGDLGMFHEGQTLPEFEAALKKMQPGDIAGPVATLYGYHVVKLTQILEPRQLRFEEVQGKIRDQLYSERFQQAYAKWLLGLRSEFPVQVY